MNINDWKEGAKIMKRNEEWHHDQWTLEHWRISRNIVFLNDWRIVSELLFFRVLLSNFPM